ncbi:protein BIG GRAIN 1-like E [Primulina huaijiensis]|uniref:protein BIG GRAIN 1-like E n=1 Tax=Primulina huaijiensis TaxID=1492673 RepID=UPI003CC7131C
MYATSPNNMYKYSFNWRNDSGELDVFEAAQYFSSAVDDQIPGNFNNAADFSQEVIDEGRQHQVRRAARMSLDSIRQHEISTPQEQAKDSHKAKEYKKYRQPSSPGGKLASFLNSLFNQTRSKKRKSQSVGPKYFEEKEIPGERRERRRSVCHFRINAKAKNVDSKSRNFCLGSGLMQATPTKPCKEVGFRDLFERQKRKDDGNLKPNSLQNEFRSEKKCTDDPWINKNSGMNWIDDQYTSEEKEFRKFSDCDDGGDTDSSSDLFELPNCDFEFYSKSLPVHETTRANSIRRVAPV